MRERYAINDKAIDPNAPTEEIDAPRSNRIYPEEFNAQIYEVEKQRRYLSEIPKSAASIMLDVNDYHSSINAGDALVAENKRKLELKTQREEMEATFKLASDNALYDKRRQMAQSMFDAEQNAINSGDTSIREAVFEAAADFEKPDEFAENPYAQETWQRIYQQDMLKYEEGARTQDLQNQQALMGYNLSDSLKLNYNKILTGTGSRDEAMAGLIATYVTYKGQMDPFEAQKGLDEGYNAFVIGEVKKLQHLAGTPGSGVTPQLAVNAMMDMLENDLTRTYNWVDEKGNVIKNEDGSNATITVKLSTKTQDALLATIKDMKGQASSAGTMGSSDFLNKFKQEVGWEEFNNKGYSEWMRVTSRPDKYNKIYETFGAIAASDWKPDKKQEVIDEVTAISAKLITSDLLATSIGYGGEDAISRASQVLNSLNTELAKNTRTDWANYSLEIPFADGNSVAVDVPKMLQPYINDDRTARLYWTEVRDSIGKLIQSSKNPANFLDGVNNNFNAVQNQVIASADALGYSLTGVAGERKVDAQKVQEFATNLRGVSNIASDAGIARAGLSDRAVQSMINQINSITGPNAQEDKVVLAMAIGGAVAESGFTSDILTVLDETGNVSEAQKLIMAGAYLSIPGTEDARNILIDAYQSGMGRTMGNSTASAITTEQLGDKNSIVSSINKKLNELNIPNEYRESLRYTFTLLGTAGAFSSGSGHNKKGWGGLTASDFDKNMEKVLKSNFHEFSKQSGLGTAYKNSYALRGTDLGKLEKVAINEKKALNYLCNRAGLSTDVGWKITDKDIRLTQNGKSITYNTGSGDVPVGVLPLEYIRTGNKVSENIINDFMTASIVSSMIASDKNFRTNMYDQALKGYNYRGELATQNARYQGYNVKFNKIKANPAVMNSQQVETMWHNVAKVVNDPKFIRNWVNTQTNPSGYFTSTGPKITDPVLDSLYVEIGSATGRPSMIENMVQAAFADSSYAGKVKQSKIPAAASMAGVGQGKGIDQLNAASQSGNTVTNVTLPGVYQVHTPSVHDFVPKKMEGGPTGFAAPVTHTKEQIKDKVTHYANMYGIPQEIAHAMIKQESGYQANVVSKAGAVGPAQLMPATAKGMGVSDINNPDQNIEGGMRYLQLQYKRFGNWEHALAAYNAGPGAVQKHGGIPPYKETQNYVKNIMAMAGKSGNSYGIGFAVDKYIDTDTNMLSTVEMNKLVTMLNNTSAYKDQVIHIATNRPELLENKPQYADYAELRKLRGANGGPLFVKGDSKDFQIALKKQKTDGKLDPSSTMAIAQDMARSQSDAFDYVSEAQASALLEVFGNRYGQVEGGRFGLANMTASEYMDYGLSADSINNPVMQGRVLMQEYQRALDLLGSPRKAIYALAGGNMVNEQGKAKSWSEIKEEKTAFMSRWFIEPSTDARERAKLNDTVAMFDQASNIYRGA